MVDLNQVVRETLALRSYEQRLSNISILEALAAGLPLVFADPHQIQQVLLNLIINAEQAMLAAHGRGTLILRTLARPRRRRGRPRSQRRWAGRAGRRAAEDLRSVLHDEGSRQGHRPRPDRRLRDRAGARRPDHRQVRAGIAARRSSSRCRSAMAR